MTQIVPTLDKPEDLPELNPHPKGQVSLDTPSLPESVEQVCEAQGMSLYTEMR